MPRLLAAAGGGVLLATAGVLLQRLSGNPMASPEVLGVSSGAAIGLVLAMFLLPGAALPWIWGTGAGAAFTVALLVMLNASSGFQPERILLCGVALGALMDAVRGIVLAGGDPRRRAPLSVDRFLGVSVFQIDRSNVVTGGFQNLSQLGEVRSQGIELEGRYGSMEGFSLQASATLLDLEILKDTDDSLVGNSLMLIPDVQVSANMGYGFTSTVPGLRIGGGVRYLGESEANAANTLQVPDATILDVYAGFALADWNLDFAISNVSDKRYVTGCNGVSVCSYGEGRELNLTVTKSFKS